MSPTRRPPLVGDMCIYLSLFWWETCCFIPSVRIKCLQAQFLQHFKGENFSNLSMFVFWHKKQMFIQNAHSLSFEKDTLMREDF
jgi:hypothetical protein